MVANTVNLQRLSPRGVMRAAAGDTGSV